MSRSRRTRRTTGRAACGHSIATYRFSSSYATCTRVDLWGDMHPGRRERSSSDGEQRVHPSTCVIAIARSIVQLLYVGSRGNTYSQMVVADSSDPTQAGVSAHEDREAAFAPRCGRGEELGVHAAGDRARTRRSIV